MKKKIFYLTIGLVVLGLPSLFAGPILDGSGSSSQKNAAAESGAGSGGTGAGTGSGTAGTSRPVVQVPVYENTGTIVAEAEAVAEVGEDSYQPRQNPATVTAKNSNVYALPATPLRRESERFPPPVYSISGVKGQPIYEDDPKAVDVVVQLPDGESFVRVIPEGTDLSDWIDNLPRGLEALAHRVKEKDKMIKIFIMGTPTETRRGTIKVTIPGTYLFTGNSRIFVGPTEEETHASWVADQGEDL